MHLGLLRLHGLTGTTRGRPHERGLELSVLSIFVEGGQVSHFAVGGEGSERKPWSFVHSCGRLRTCLVVQSDKGFLEGFREPGGGPNVYP